MKEAGPKRAAQYVRMSTDHQRYSVELQTVANAAYAAERGYDVVRTYMDEGISGLTLKKREGLKSLLADVMSGQTDFSLILVYDISRWGRFQDPDQSAHYEFLCKEAGVQVEYCTEPFENDGSALSSIVKSLKRAMAAEYSRELSEKVHKSQQGLSRKGYWQGGPPGVGLRRQPLAHDGRMRPVLEPGEANGVRGDRIVLVPGPEVEVALVRRIFQTYLDGLSPRMIAAKLNLEGIRTVRLVNWSQYSIRYILRNEAYAGVYVTGRRRCKLGVHTKLPRATWVRIEGAFQPIVPKSVFDAVQRRFRRTHPQTTDEQLLEALADLVERTGKATLASLHADREMCSVSLYSQRFGGIRNAYRLIGYEWQPRDPEEARIARNARRRANSARGRGHKPNPARPRKLRNPSQ